ncbi:hypothetical protein H0V99_00060 [Candidatus Saccharibacteria bacterium]|nr:hypothetical protein [Candidatus Saccharibacteria bacterium]
MTKGITFVTTVMSPLGTVNPSPRQYFRTVQPIGESDAKNLGSALSKVCKHVSNVYLCTCTPSGEAASFYVSFGGMDPNSRSTQGRLAKYGDDIRRAIQGWLASMKK